MFRPRAARLGSEGSANSRALCMKHPALPGLPMSTLLDPMSSRVRPSACSLDWGSEGQGPLRSLSGAGFELCANYPGVGCRSCPVGGLSGTLTVPQSDLPQTVPQGDLPRVGDLDCPQGDLPWAGGLDCPTQGQSILCRFKARETFNIKIESRFLFMGKTLKSILAPL